MKANEIYARQNKLLHQAFTMKGMPYEDNKEYWLGVVLTVIGRAVMSLAGMSLGERSAVLWHLSASGVKIYNPFVPRAWENWKKGDPEPAADVTKRPMKVAAGKMAMVRKVAAILTDMRLPWSYADELAKSRFGVDFVEWCEPGDLHKVVQMLVIHQKRNGGPGVRERRRHVVCAG